jgi:hypothetical protein
VCHFSRRFSRSTVGFSTHSRPRIAPRLVPGAFAKTRSLRSATPNFHVHETSVTMASASSLASIQAPPVALRASALARARAAARARGPIVPRAAASAPPMSGIGACHAGAFLSETEKAHLVTIAAMIGTPGKGITACDEGPGTIGDRFEAVGVVNTEENRRAYRQVLFESEGANEFLSAAILDPETLYQKSSTNGELFPKVLMARGIVPGVKPHLKIFALPGQNGATVMQGLDSLAVRCAEYKAAGCEFAKVRPCAFLFPNPGRLFDALYGVQLRKFYQHNKCTRVQDCLLTV